MKNIVWIALLAGMLGTAVALAQDASPTGGHPPALPPEQFQQMELQQRGLELQARAAKLVFERDMDNLQLEQRRIEVERLKQALGATGGMPHAGRGPGHGWRCAKALLLVCFVVNILLAIWVCQDIRRRNAGSRIWIFVALLTGLFGTAVYALVRLGEKPIGPA